MWEVEFTDEFGMWWSTLTIGQQERIAQGVRTLEHDGPSLGRPLVDRIKQSRHHNMKEMRVSTIRILFAFDPETNAILLIGGDKQGMWNKWYDNMVPAADDLYDQHLAELEREHDGQ